MNTEIRNLLDCHVVGSDGQSIGKVGQVYLNDRTGEPEWVTVRTGFFGMKQTFVPLQDARRSGEEIRVPFDKEMIKGAPNIDVDGRLSLDEEADLYRYYGMRPTDVPRQRPADFGDTGERQGFATDSREGLAAGGPGLMDEPGTGTGTGTGTGVGAGVGTGTGAGLGMGSGMSDMDRSDGLDESDRLIGDTPGTTDEPGLMPEGRTMGLKDDQPRGFTDEPRGFAGETGGFAEDRDIDMTRSEEQLHIGKERRESGRVRLHKYVETENVQESVPLSHEEVVIEREDIRDAGWSGAYEIGAEDREMILHEERPVIGKETVPVERIHVHKQDVQGEEIVEGQIRRERLEIDEEGPTRDDGGYGREEGFPPRR
ncbi:PRC and DUF2382 domain-containing protein [Nonomuraea sp. NPDC049419]|uniref:PRC and DUF2382 domain-containing protein n=1 Tax=Nonomuraea sp. NPDC049419 TaxID=3155772 RepID=UPI0034263F4F